MHCQQGLLLAQNFPLFIARHCAVHTLSYATLQWWHQNTLNILLSLFSFSCHINEFLFNNIFSLSGSSVRWWQYKVERQTTERVVMLPKGRKGGSYKLCLEIFPCPWNLTVGITGKNLCQVFRSPFPKTKLSHVDWLEYAERSERSSYITGRKFVSFEFIRSKHSESQACKETNLFFSSF